jgi:hypothetical protein
VAAATQELHGATSQKMAFFTYSILLLEFKASILIGGARKNF